MNELITWVDENDTVIGYGEKLETHRKEQLHRAFSLFVYNRRTGTLLLHRRAPGKYHSGGLWTNSCCSHQRQGEQLREAVIRRAGQELGLFFAPEELAHPADGLRELGHFRYYQRYTDLAEHEVDHVFLILLDRPQVALNPDPGEMDMVQWITPDALDAWLAQRPEEFTAWFARAYALVRLCLP